MKLLITGSPKSGKSTTLSEIINGVTPRRGFITKEVVNERRRTGFVVEDMNKRSAVLAQTKNQTSLQVGRFYVQPEVLAEFTKNLSHPEVDELLYIDEIGQMQLNSDKFKTLVKEYLGAPNDFLATITNVYSDKLVEGILKRNDIILFELTERNRIVVKKSLSIALSNRDSFNKLAPTLQSVVVMHANIYLSDGLYISFGKLFSNAIKYFLEDRISVATIGVYVVKGNTNEHVVHYASRSDWSCDCPLSKGKEQFSKAADCSHIQAVQLFVA
jgi:nucleoside-triphosphatase THEP1